MPYCSLLIKYKTDLAFKPTVLSSSTLVEARDLRVETMKAETCSDGSIQVRTARPWSSAVVGWANGRTETAAILTSAASTGLTMMDIRIGRITVGFNLAKRFRALIAMVLRALQAVIKVTGEVTGTMCSISLTRALSAFKWPVLPKARMADRRTCSDSVLSISSTRNGMNFSVRTGDSLVPKTPKTLVGKLFLMVVGWM